MRVLLFPDDQKFYNVSTLEKLPSKKQTKKLSLGIFNFYVQNDNINFTSCMSSEYFNVSLACSGKLGKNSTNSSRESLKKVETVNLQDEEDLNPLDPEIFVVPKKKIHRAQNDSIDSVLRMKMHGVPSPPKVSPLKNPSKLY